MNPPSPENWETLLKPGAVVMVRYPENGSNSWRAVQARDFIRTILRTRDEFLIGKLEKKLKAGHCSWCKNPIGDAEKISANVWKDAFTDAINIIRGGDKE